MNKYLVFFEFENHKKEYVYKTFDFDMFELKKNIIREFGFVCPTEFIIIKNVVKL